MIKELIEKLCCCHDWKTYSKTDWIDPDTDDTWTSVVLICNKCGKIKRIKKL